nr:thioredoxin family protein [Candidatus Woesearchaeota archaeon]
MIKIKTLVLVFVLIAISTAIILLRDKNTGGNDLLFKNKAPELKGIYAWINSEPLTLKELKGRVVLVDFWTYSCINCIRTLPYVKEWDEKYRDKGLVIIGVHSPEFFFEKKLQNVQEAVDKNQIKYPVALDNDFETWKVFDNHYWPRKYLIDKNGNIRYDHIGEGGYEETEKAIQELLSELGKKVEMETVKDPEREIMPLTPELYAGYAFARKELGNKEGYQPDKTINYSLPDDIKEDTIYLSGKWYNDKDNLKCENDNCFVYLNFMAKSVNIVSSSEENVELEILLDDKTLTEKNKGFDVDEKSIVSIKEPRLYNLIGNKNQYGRYLLKIKAEKGFMFNAFTFG